MRISDWSSDVCSSDLAPTAWQARQDPFRRAARMLRDSWRIGRLGQNTLLGTGGLAIRALIQAGYLLVLSRWLGASGYGLFAGSVAVAILGAPLAGWGGAPSGRASGVEGRVPYV